MAIVPIGSDQNAKPPRLPDLLSLIPKGSAGVSGATPEDIQRATDITQIGLQSQGTGIQTAIDQIQTFLNRDVDMQQRFGTLADERLANLSTQLQGTLQNQANQVGDIYSQGVQNVGGAYDEALNTITQAGQGIQGGLAQRAGSLGLEAALTGNENPMDRLRAELSVLQGRTAASKAGATSNLQTLGTQMQGFAQERVGAAGQEFASRRANLVNQVQSTIGELQLRSGEDTRELLQKFADYAALVGPTFRSTLAEITQARTKAEHDAMMDELKMQMDMAKMVREDEKFRWQQQKDVASHTLARDRATGNLDPEMRNLNLLNKELDAALKQKKLLDPGTSAGGERKGEKGLVDWLNTTGRSNQFSGFVKKFIADAEATSADTGINPYQLAVQELNTRRLGKGQFVYDYGGKQHKGGVDHLLTALRIYFKGEGKDTATKR